MNVQVTSDAFADVQNGYDFYELQERGLGTYFSRCIEQDLKELRITAGIHRKIRGYHRVNSQIFNTILYYRMDQDTAIVMAILDGRIDPATRDRILKNRR
jgi:hypothetical protein